MATNSRNKFRVISEEGNNIQTNSEFDNDEDRKLGFQAGQTIQSKKVNTGLRETSLVITALVDALISDEDEELSPASNLDEVVDFFKNKLSNLSKNKSRTLLQISSGDICNLKWNDNYYVINKSAKDSSTISLDEVDTNIYQTCTFMLQTNEEESVITFDETLEYYLLNGHQDLYVTTDGNKFTFTDKGNYLITLTVKDSGTVYVNILKGEYTETIHIENPKINSYTATSTNGSFPSLVLNITNTNLFDVGVQARLDGSLEYIDKGTITAGDTMDILLDNDSLYKGTSNIKFVYTTKITKEVTASKVWNSTFNINNSSQTASGSSSSTYRTITITGVVPKGNATIKLYYKTWKSNESEPSDYKEKELSSTDLTVTSSYSNSTYSNQTIYAKSYMVMNVDDQEITSSVISDSWTLSGQTMPTLNAPTITYSSRGYCGTGTMVVSIKNPNNVTCNVYVKTGSGSYTNVGTISANTTTTFNLTGVSDGSGTAYCYLTATNYYSSSVASTTYPACVNPCSCDSYTCSCDSYVPCSCDSYTPCSCDSYVPCTCESYVPCTSTEEKCSTTYTKCSSTQTKCSTTLSQCSSTESQCSSTESQCSSSYDKCSSTQSKCTTTVSACTTTQQSCTDSTSKCTTTTSLCTTPIQACTTTESSCSSTQTQCSDDTSKCMTEYDTCTSIQTKCSSTESQCSTTKYQCSSTASKCTTTQSSCTSTVSQCTDSTSQCTTTASKCTTNVSTCTTSIQTSACMTTEGTCSANVSLALGDVPTDVELTSDVDSSKDIQVDTTDLDILGLS